MDNRLLASSVNEKTDYFVSMKEEYSVCKAHIARYKRGGALGSRNICNGLRGAQLQQGVEGPGLKRLVF